MSKSSVESVIRVSDVAKEFKLPHEKEGSIKGLFLSMFSGRRTYERQRVLKDISFDIKKGEFFGVVGRNGSGKSTLLKLLAGIYTPDKGHIEVNGKLTPFIELGVGFNPELTGRENVFLNGALLGFSRDEMATMYDEIVEFAELEKFMDQKLKNYSSGMQVRLAFSIAIRVNTDILVLDEVLAVGDEAFQRKCSDFFEKIKKDKTKTVVLVTHDMDAVRKYCNRAVFIRDGEVVAIGSPDKVANEYSLENFEQKDEVGLDDGHNKDRPKLKARFISSQVLTRKDEMIIEAKYKAVSTRPVLIKFAPLAFGSASLMTANSKVVAGITTSDTNEHKVQFRLPMHAFNNGEFSVVVLLADAETGVNIADYGYNKELPFRVSDKETSAGGAFVNQGSIDFIN